VRGRGTEGEGHLKDVTQIKELAMSIATDIHMSFALPVDRERDSEEGGLGLVELLGRQENLEEILPMDQALRLE
jgi:hypothetical protein